MVSAYSLRSDFERLQSGYRNLANDLGHRRLDIERQSTAEREPLRAAVKALVDDHVTDLDDPKLADFGQPARGKDNGFDVPGIVASMRGYQNKIRRQYEPFAQYDQAQRVSYIVENDMRMNSRKIDEASRVLYSLKNPLAHIDSANKTLEKMGAPQITAETAKEYSTGNIRRWWSDEAFRVARAAVKSYERDIRKRQDQPDLKQDIEARQTANADIAASNADNEKLGLELQAARLRPNIHTDAELLAKVKERITRQADDREYLEHLVNGQMGAGLPDDALERAVKADALDALAGDIGRSKAAAEAGARKFGEAASRLSGKRGQVRGYVDTSRMRSDLENFKNRAMSRSSASKDAAKAIADYRFDTVVEKGGDAQQPSAQSAQSMYLVLAAAVLISIDNNRSSVIAGQLDIGKDDLAGAGISVDEVAITPDFGTGDISVDVPDVSVSVPDTSSSFGFGGFD